MRAPDEEVRAWELELAARVGWAVARRRKALGLSGVQLAERTKTLGYPMTRQAIGKIENNSRAGKLDVAELLILAVALEIPPVLLLYPGYPSVDLQFLPGGGDVETDSLQAAEWLSGERPLPMGKGHKRIGQLSDVLVNAGVVLVQTGRQWRRALLGLTAIRAEQGGDMEQALQIWQQDIAEKRASLEEHVTALWGPDEDDDRGDDDG